MEGAVGGTEGGGQAMNTGFLRSIELTGPGFTVVDEGFEEWVGLWQVNFTARWGNREMGVGVAEVGYEIVGVCEGGGSGTA